MKKELLHPAKVAAAVKKYEQEVRDTCFDDAAKVFGSKTLQVHDFIKTIMRQHFLDYQNANLQAAFIRLAMCIKEGNYPKAIKK